MLDHQVSTCLKFIKYRSYIHNLFTGYIAGFLNHQQFDWDFQELTNRWWLTLEDMFHQPHGPSTHQLTWNMSICICHCLHRQLLVSLFCKSRSWCAIFLQCIDQIALWRNTLTGFLGIGKCLNIGCLWCDGCVCVCVCVSIWPGPQKPQFHTERITWRFWDTLVLRFLFKRITFWEMRAGIKEYHWFRWSWLH